MKYSSFLQSSIYLRFSSFFFANGRDIFCTVACLLAVQLVVLWDKSPELLPGRLPDCGSYRVHKMTFNLLQQNMKVRGVNTDTLKLADFTEIERVQGEVVCRFRASVKSASTLMHVSIKRVEEPEESFKIEVFPAM